MGEFEHKFVNTNGIRMHLHEAGSGFPVVMCHGFPEMWYSWRHQIRALAAAGFRAIAPDLTAPESIVIVPEKGPVSVGAASTVTLCTLSRPSSNEPAPVTLSGEESALSSTST